MFGLLRYRLANGLREIADKLFNPETQFKCDECSAIGKVGDSVTCCYGELEVCFECYKSVGGV